MVEALDFLTLFLSELSNFLFNDALISTGVSVGFVIVVVIFARILVTGLLNVGKSSQSFNVHRGDNNE